MGIGYVVVGGGVCIVVCGLVGHGVGLWIEIVHFRRNV